MPNKFIIAERKTSAVSGRFFTAGPFDGPFDRLRDPRRA